MAQTKQTARNTLTGGKTPARYPLRHHKEGEDTPESAPETEHTDSLEEQEDDGVFMTVPAQTGDTDSSNLPDADGTQEQGEGPTDQIVLPRGVQPG